jgi:RHS repeat-associated protein
MVAVRFNAVTAGTVTTRYFHKDGLGSIAALTDENGTVVQRLSYDPWGKQRSPSTWSDDPTGSLPTQDQTTRGFTGQEQLEDVGLVHMNARVYDPQLGRFLSADSMVEDPYNAQSFNRYSYVYDNPLAHTDPSGHCFISCHFFHSVANFFTGGLAGGIKSAVMIAARPVPFELQFVPGVNRAVDTFVRNNQIVQTGLTVAATVAGAVLNEFCGCGAAIVAGNAMYLAGVNGGRLSDMLKAGAIAGGTAEASSLGQYVGPSVVIQAAIGCASAAASGGSCGSGALSGAISAAAGAFINTGNFAINVTLNAVVGGVASVAGGGKFANGAITGAFGYIVGAISEQNGQNSQSADPVLFFGGAEDGTNMGDSGIVSVYAKQFADAHPDTITRYFNENQRNEAFDYILSLPEGTTITAVGHSWGGDNAAAVAEHLPGRIGLLITIDPVSWFTPSYSTVRASVGVWMDVNAAPSRPNFSDIVQWIGSGWGTGPKGHATTFMSVDTNHGDFPGMMRALGTYGH